MGEPVPGDIPDPTHVKTANVLLANDIIQSKGDWLIYSSSPASWNPPIQTAARIISEQQAVQLQQDINTTDILNAVANAAAFGNGSWVYALCAGNVEPNSPVHLVVYDSGSAVFKIGFVSAFTVNIASIAFSTPEVTVTTSTPHNLQQGDIVGLNDTTGNTNDGKFLVLTVPSTTTFTISNVGGAVQGGAAGTSNNNAADNNAAAKFIKRSGDTFSQEGVLNEIGVFSMTGLGL